LNYGKTSYTRGRELSRTTNTEERTRLLIQPNELLKYPRGRAIVINPGISDQNECYIPLNHQFNLSPKHFGLVERNEANWDSFLEYYLLQKSLSESDQITREDLAEYRRYIEAEFPITSENT
jgi:type IV secretory pathway TraG/TraD family ATPase VirD4